VTTKRAVGLLGLLVVLLVLGVVGWRTTRGARVAGVAEDRARPMPARPAPSPPPSRPARAPGEPIDTTSGLVDGSVVDQGTRRGIPRAELTFLDGASASTFHTSADGSFLLTPPATGVITLAAITAPGYLPYTPGHGEGGVKLLLAHGPPVHGVMLALAPATDTEGLVIDAKHAPVAGAKVRLVGGPPSELLGDSPAVWTTGRDGKFTFQAGDDGVLEASHRGARGMVSIEWYRSERMPVVIQIGRAAPLDATITGRVRDTTGAPVAEAVVRATPSAPSIVASTVFATSDADGTFTLVGVDHAAYDVTAELDDHLPAVRANVLGGARNVDLVIDAGLALVGRVVDRRGAPVPAFTVVVRWRTGVAHAIAATASIIDPQGRFALRIRPGDYELIAQGRGCAHSVPARASAGATELRLVIDGGPPLRGRVIASDDDTPIDGASVACEVTGLGRHRAPGELATTTEADGTFELTDVPDGPLELRARANGFHARLESLDRRGGALAPLTLELTRVEPGEQRRTEMIGIGVALTPDRDALRVFMVDPDGSAFDAGIQFGDLVDAIDGVPVTQLGVDGAMARIRGTAGTTVTLTLRRDGEPLHVTVARRRQLGWAGH
jgi:Carboxypeptidase regulatory-like domain/PDZ domain